MGIPYDTKRFAVYFTHKFKNNVREATILNFTNFNLLLVCHFSTLNQIAFLLSNAFRKRGCAALSASPRISAAFTFNKRTPWEAI